MEDKIFICYSQVDHDRVKAIKEEIEQATGLECFMNSCGSNPLNGEVTKRWIDERPIFLFMLSDHSQKWKPTLRDLEYAMQKLEADVQRHVLIVGIQQCELAMEILSTVILCRGAIDWDNLQKKEKLICNLKRWTRVKTEITPTSDPSEILQLAEDYYDEGKNYQTISLRNPLDRPKGWFEECENKMMACYRKAAYLGLAEAQYQLALNIMPIGDVPVEKTIEAAKWYRKAAEQGYAEAQYSLGWCYAKGQGVAQDYAEAMKWWQKAAEQGHEDAELVLQEYENKQKSL